MDFLKQDLVTNLAFYGAYHQNFYNQLIHIVFVPLLWFSGSLFIANYSKFASLVVYLFYTGFYIYLDAKTGSVASFVYTIFYILSIYLVDNEKKNEKNNYKAKFPKGFSIKLAIFLQLIGWFAQIVPGHMHYEGRKPALLDSLVQSFTLAPLFVFYEFIWYFIDPTFQYDLKQEMQKRIQEINI